MPAGHRRRQAVGQLGLERAGVGRRRVDRRREVPEPKALPGWGALRRRRRPGDHPVEVGLGEGAGQSGRSGSACGGPVGDVGAAVEAVVTAAGYGNPRHYCGHGIGRAMHEDPDVENRGKPGRGHELLAGMVLAIEPMLLGGGSDDVFELDDGWTIATADGSLAAHVEHTVLVGPNGPEILTQL